jgi:environmental stress-induced protein Ves
MITVLPSSGFRQGRWLNGMGVSWDIAAEPKNSGSADFAWRFAIARIDADVPFSRYSGVDRVFTLIEGEGLTLDLEGRAPLIIDRTFVPHAFPGDVATSCRLLDGPCRALNLFLARGPWVAEVKVVQGAGQLAGGEPMLLFALDGDVALEDRTLHAGEAAVASGVLHYEAGPHLLYAARLFRKT